MTSTPRDSAVEPLSALLARAAQHTAAVSERLLAEYLARLLSEQGVAVLTGVVPPLLLTVQSLSTTLPRLVREGATDEALALARALGERMHESGVSLSGLMAEGMRLHDRFLHESIAQFRGSDHVPAMAVLQMNRSLMEVEQALLMAYQERALATLTHLARSDSLTGLSNRRAFDQRLEAELRRAARVGRSLALVLLDVDGLKRINDTFGHAVGDQLLHAISMVLREHTREIDEVARIGGDEFALLLPESDRAGATTLVQRLLESVAGRQVHGQPLHVSVGVSVYPADGRTAAELTRQADEAMYRDKRGS